MKRTTPESRWLHVFERRPMFGREDAGVITRCLRRSQKRGSAEGAFRKPTLNPDLVLHLVTIKKILKIFRHQPRISSKAWNLYTADNEVLAALSYSIWLIL